VSAQISGSADTQADLHVVLGPWFAFDKWRYHETLYIDRAYWNDPECISVHWLVNGEKLFTTHNPKREHPALLPLKHGNKKIYLCDYQCQPEGEYDTVRHHPAKSKQAETLHDALNRHDIAAGKRTTALVDAAFMGLRVETNDPYSPVHRLSHVGREQWARDMAWHNWSLKEIAIGDMWNVLGRD